MQKQLLIYLLFLCGIPLLNALLPARSRRVFLLAVSLVFYYLISGKYVLVLAFAAFVAWGAAILMRKKPERSQVILAASLTVIIGVLCVFKYLGFAAETLSRVLAHFGAGPVTVSPLVTPIGISFFTFAASGYLIDVFRKKSEPERDLLTLALFLAFFPTVLSGPIERSDTLLPQLRSPELPDRETVRYGVTRFLIGLAKKLLLADQLAIIVNHAYSAYGETSGLVLLLAALCYTVQIYCDFSGYTDMAAGGAALLGFRLSDNFRQPYFARSVKEFWRRWHISLSGWFRDYLYFPLGGNRRGRLRTWFNILFVFGVSGLWHGAAWSFVIWGLLNGLFQVIGDIADPARKRLQSLLHIRGDGRSLRVWQTLLTFLLMTFAWIFFRADGVTQAVMIIKRIFTLKGGLYIPTLAEIGKTGPGLVVLALSVVLLLVNDMIEQKKAPAETLAKDPGRCWLVWCALIFLILVFGAWGNGFNPQEFVYFKF